MKHRTILLLGLVAAFRASSLFGQHAPGRTDAGPAERLRRSWEEAFRELSKPDGTQTLFRARTVAEDEAEKAERLARVLASTTPFVEPPVVIDVNGSFSADLTVDYADNRLDGVPVRLRSYNGGLIGPTLRVRPGAQINIWLQNRLPEEPHASSVHNTLHQFNTTNLHVHGLHVSPAGRSDNVLLSIKPGREFRYVIDVGAKHDSGTFWYHAHHHGSVAAQVSSGMAGALIVEDSDEIKGLKGVAERLFVFQQFPYVMQHGVGVVEEEFSAESFGPGTWDKLGYTTAVNGQILPVLYMRPGEVQRWRLIHAGVREGIGLRMQCIEGRREDRHKFVTLYEIAKDGMYLGKREPERGVVRLFPGYRVDVLAQAKNPGIYVLMDDLIPDVSPLTQDPKFHPKYLAKVIVVGDEQEMSIPSADDLPKRKKSIKDKPNGTQTATYSIEKDPLRFEVDGHSFGPTRIRRLRLGDVDEWTIRSVNDPPLPPGVKKVPVDHPFHVHVNPFEVVEVLDSEKRPLTEENAFSEYGWHDTLLLRDGWTYKFRMKYDDFTGQFFQHCHILDHEDLGMMETIEIVKNLQAPVAPRAASSSHMAVPGPQFAGSWSLPDARGVIHRSDEFAGPTVLLFVRGKGCLHCLEQLNAFAKHSRDFEKAGAKLVVISTDDTATLRAAADADRATPFLFLSDGAADVFRRFGCDEAVATHGTFVLRDGGRIGWKSIGREPFTQADQVLEALGQPATKP